MKPFKKKSPKLYRSYYPHRSRELVSPVCGIFLRGEGIPQKNPAHRRHWISLRVQIVAPIPKRTETERKEEEEKNICVTSHMSGVRCHMSCVRYHMSGVTCTSNFQTGADILREGSPPPTCQVSGVTCHVSSVTCQESGVRWHMSGVRCQIFSLFFLFLTKWWS